MAASFRNTKVPKYRHAYGQPAKRENCYEGMRITTSAHDSQFCAVNPKFVAVVLEVSGGGAFQVVPIKMTGKIDYNFGRVKGHCGPLNDLKWNPFDDNTIATCSDDCTVKLWFIPDVGVTTVMTKWLCELTGHSRRVGHIEWHPTANNVLISAGFDFNVFIWNVGNGEKINVLDCHQDVVYSMSFNFNGSLLSTTSKDRMLRVINPRNGQVLQSNICHESSKTSKVVYLDDKKLLLTTGFSKTSHRQYAVWDENNLSQPLIKSEIDSSAGVLFPFFDADLSILYLAGKGDGNVRFYEVTDSPPYVQYLSEFQSRFPQRSLGVMPKRALDVGKCEIFRFYKVHVIQTILEPLSIIVPRKTEGLRVELYPSTAGSVASVTAEEWSYGIDRNPVRITITDNNAAIKRTHGNFNTCSSGIFNGRQQPLSPSCEAKFQFLSQITKPDYRCMPVKPNASMNIYQKDFAASVVQKLTDRRLLNVDDNDARLGTASPATGTTRNEEEVENLLNQEEKENLQRKRVDDKRQFNEEISSINGQSSNVNNKSKNCSSIVDAVGIDDDNKSGRTSVNIPNKIRRICQSPSSSLNGGEDHSSSPSTVLDHSRRSSSWVRTRSASPMSPVQIQSNIDERDVHRLVKPQPLHFNGNINHKPPTKPGLIAPGPIVKRNDNYGYRDKTFRISHSQPPTPRPDQSSTGLDTLDPSFVDKIFAHQSKTLKEVFDENFVKDKRIEHLENELARLNLKVEQLENDLKQKQDDVDSLRYEITWKDRRVIQLEQQLYKHSSVNEGSKLP